MVRAELRGCGAFTEVSQGRWMLGKPSGYKAAAADRGHGLRGPAAQGHRPQAVITGPGGQPPFAELDARLRPEVGIPASMCLVMLGAVLGMFAGFTLPGCPAAWCPASCAASWAYLHEHLTARDDRRVHRRCLRPRAHRPRLSQGPPDGYGGLGGMHTRALSRAMAEAIQGAWRGPHPRTLATGGPGPG
jgi:hypothetical protein